MSDEVGDVTQLMSALKQCALHCGILSLVCLNQQVDTHAHRTEMLQKV